MEYSIFDILASNKRAKADILKAMSEEKQDLKTFLEKHYKADIKAQYHITKAEAVLINLGSVEIINTVYYRNFTQFSKSAYTFVKNKLSSGNFTPDIEDITQQIYIDIRYYNFESLNTLKKCILKTMQTVKNGGITNSEAYKKEIKKVVSFNATISAHNSKMAEARELLEILEADERTTNPEIMAVIAEDGAEQRKQSQAIYKTLMASMQGKDRIKLAKLYEGVFDDEDR